MPHHWAYSLYLFLCVLQLPLHLILCTLECYMPCTLVERATLARLPDCTMAGATGAMCVASTLFAVLYMALTSHEDDDFAAAWLTSGPDANEGGSVLLELARAAFWGFAWFQGLALAGGLLERVTAAELLLATVTRLAPLWALCRTNSDSRSRLWRTATVGACALWYGTMLLAVAHHRPLPSVPTLLAYAACDALLVLGHLWDTTPTTLLVLNCRLFFVAATASLTQLLSVLLQ